MAGQRKGGIIQVQVGGVMQEAKGTFTYGLGTPKRDTVVGADGVHGFKETPQVAFLEGAFTDRASLDAKALLETEDATVTLVLANGKTVVFRDAWYAGEGTISTDEGEIGVRFEAKSAEEI
jgi:hypothetical protein